MKLNKFIKVIILPLVIIFSLSGCAKDNYIFVKPSYPIISVPNKVPEVDAEVKNRCLWLNDHNTNLCNEDLREILVLIKDLRTNEMVYRKNIHNYNEFVSKKRKQKIVKKL